MTVQLVAPDTPSALPAVSCVDQWLTSLARLLPGLLLVCTSLLPVSYLICPPPSFFFFLLIFILNQSVRTQYVLKKLINPEMCLFPRPPVLLGWVLIPACFFTA